MNERIEKIIEFLQVIEEYKHILRHNYKKNEIRESDAEHSWHLAMFLVMFEKELPDIDMKKALKLALVHDLVEIYAGDVNAFDEQAKIGKYQRELEAAKKLFDPLPKDLRKEMMDLFEEYEKCDTKEAQIVKSFDKIQPIIQNMAAGGIGWTKGNVTIEMVDNYKRKHMQHNEFILKLYENILEKAKKQMKEIKSQ